MIRFLSTAIIALVVSLAVARESVAQDWTYTLTPYLWAPAMNLTLDIGPNPPVSGEQSLLEVIDGAFLIQGEARRDRWSIMGEFNYLNLTDDFGLAPGSSRASWRVEGTMIALAAGYAVHETQGTRVDVIGGLRAWDLTTSTKVLNARASRSNSFIDPMVGVRVEKTIGRKAQFLGLANIGGSNFGSDRQLEAIAQVRWPINDRLSWSAGYRYLSLDFEDNGALLDATLSGPFVSLGVNF